MAVSTLDTNRVLWVDVLKGLAIISVVYLHCHNGYMDISPIDAKFIKWLTSFHMCLFFSCSGYFYKRDRANRSSLWAKIESLGTPYIIYGVLIGFFVEVMRVTLSPQPWSIHNEVIDLLLFKKAYNACWFLATLLGVYLVEYFVSKIKSKFLIKAIHLLFLFLGLFLQETIIGKYFYLSKILIATYFFELGIIICRYKFKGRGWISIVMLLVASFLSSLNSQVTYSNDAFGNIFLFISSSTLSVVGFLLLFNRLEILCREFLCNKNTILDRLTRNVVSFFTFFGKDSIFVLIFHSIYLLGFRVIEQLLGMSLHSIPIWLEFVLLLFLSYYTIKYAPDWLRKSLGKHNCRTRVVRLIDDKRED